MVKTGYAILGFEWKKHEGLTILWLKERYLHTFWRTWKPAEWRERERPANYTEAFTYLKPLEMKVTLDAR